MAMASMLGSHIMLVPQCSAFHYSYCWLLCCVRWLVVGGGGGGGGRLVRSLMTSIRLYSACMYLVQLPSLSVQWSCLFHRFCDHCSWGEPSLGAAWTQVYCEPDLLLQGPSGPGFLRCGEGGQGE